MFVIVRDHVTITVCLTIWVAIVVTIRFVVVMMVTMVVVVLVRVRVDWSICVRNGLKRRRDHLVLLVFIIAIIVEHVIGGRLLVVIITRYGFFENERRLGDQTLRLGIIKRRCIDSFVVLVCLARVDHRHAIVAVVAVTVVCVVTGRRIVFGVFRID